MKKSLFVAPIVAISLLASCNKGGGDDPGPVVNTYTITFDCQQCKAFDKDDKEVSSVTVPVVESEHVMYQKFHFEGNKPFKVPLKSNISIKKTGTEEKVDFEYSNGNIFVPIIGDLTISAEGISYSKSLEESNWDEIAAIADSGRADEFFDVGNTKAVRLNGQNFDHTIRIIDFNHDDLADGSGKAGITFEFVNVITNDSKTSSVKPPWDFTNNYDYRQSFVNDFLNDETGEAQSVINMLPGDLKKEGIIKPVKKLVGVSTDEGKKFIATPFEEIECPKLFLLAYDEIHNPNGTGYEYATHGEAGNAGIYKYYEEHGGDEEADVAYRIKNIVDGSLDPGTQYCLRSPSAYYDDYCVNCVFCVGALGFINYMQKCSKMFAISPAFCI